MPRYRRDKIEGGVSFFTLVLADRGSDLLPRHIERLRRAYAGVERRLLFTTVAICILQDHIHALWQLPDGALEPVQIRFLTRPRAGANALGQQDYKTCERHLATPLLGTCHP